MGEAKRKRLCGVAVTGEELAAYMEDSGYTSPDKHDFILSVLGDRIRVAEIGLEGDRVKTMAGETNMDSAKRMFSALRADHYVGIVNVMISKDADCLEFLEFLSQQAKAKKFTVITTHGPRTAKQVFEGFFESLGDVPTQGAC